MKLNIQELSGFVALGCKSARVASSHPSIKVARISSLLAQIEQVKLVIINYRVTATFWKEKIPKCGFMTDGDTDNLLAFFVVLFCIWLVATQSTCQNQINTIMAFWLSQSKTIFSRVFQICGTATFQIFPEDSMATSQTTKRILRWQGNSFNLTQIPMGGWKM